MSHYGAAPLQKLNLVVFPFDDLLEPALSAVAKRVIHPDFPRKRGKSVERMESYFAGRVAVRWWMERCGVMGYVGPDAKWGFPKFYDAQRKGRDDLFLNISHTQRIVVAAFSRRPVGVDIEHVDRDVSQVLKRVTSRQERVLADEWSEKNPNFPSKVALWSAKEAFAKALGIGMNFGLQAFVIPLEGESPIAVKTDRRGPLHVNDPVVTFHRHEDFLISICGERSEQELGLERFIVDKFPF